MALSLLGLSAFSLWSDYAKQGSLRRSGDNDNPATAKNDSNAARANQRRGDRDTVDAAASPPSAAVLEAASRSRPYGFCPEPGEEQAPTLRPSLTRYYAAHQTDEAAPALRRAMDAHTRHDAVAEREGLRAALRLAPDAAIALPLALDLVDTPDLAEAIAALNIYLRSHPTDVQMSRLRARVGIQEELQRDFAHLEKDGIRLLWPPDLISAPDADSLVGLVAAALDEAARLGDVPRRRELTVIVYRDTTDLLAATCTPTWVGGVYDGSLKLVYNAGAPLGVPLRELRHEALHAELSEYGHSQPVWLHEGLAQYFSGEESAEHRRSYRFMVKNQTYIPFSSLNGSFLVFTGGSDAGLAYHQSLAMVQWLIERNGIAVISKAMHALGEGAEPTALLGRLTAPSTLTEHDLLDFLARRQGD